MQLVKVLKEVGIGQGPRFYIWGRANTDAHTFTRNLYRSNGHMVIPVVIYRLVKSTI